MPFLSVPHRLRRRQPKTLSLTVHLRGENPASPFCMRGEEVERGFSLYKRVVRWYFEKPEPGVREEVLHPSRLNEWMQVWPLMRSDGTVDRPAP